MAHTQNILRAMNKNENPTMTSVEKIIEIVRTEMKFAALAKDTESRKVKYSQRQRMRCEHTREFISLLLPFRIGTTY